MLRKKGFTLTEFLVVIAIIVILASIIMPALDKARETARRVVCVANLHNIGLLVLICANDHEQMLPWYRGWTLLNRPDFLSHNASGTDWIYILAGSATFIPRARMYICPSAENPIPTAWGFGKYGSPNEIYANALGDQPTAPVPTCYQLITGLRWQRTSVDKDAYGLTNPYRFGSVQQK